MGLVHFLYIRPGGMPSAHAAMVSAAAHGVGLYIGYNTAAFATAFILALIVIYDAINVRFHSGRHARSINILTGTLHSDTRCEMNRCGRFLATLPAKRWLGRCLASR